MTEKWQRIKTRTENKDSREEDRQDQNHNHKTHLLKREPDLMITYKIRFRKERSTLPHEKTKPAGKRNRKHNRKNKKKKYRRK